MILMLNRVELVMSKRLLFWDSLRKNHYSPVQLDACLRITNACYRASNVMKDARFLHETLSGQTIYCIKPGAFLHERGREFTLLLINSILLNIENVSFAALVLFFLLLSLLFSSYSSHFLFLYIQRCYS
jgi:hypothetical protein